MTHRRRIRSETTWLLLAFWLAGCASGGGAAGNAALPGDACANQLHEISGELLQYYAQRGGLPTRLSELAEVTGRPVADTWRCPAGGELYVYQPDGPRLGATAERAILFARLPDHTGRRWAVVIREPAEGQALLTRVVRLPERVFAP